MIIAGNLKMDAKALLSDHGFLASMIYIQINFNYEYIIELISIKEKLHCIIHTIIYSVVYTSLVFS